MIESSSEHASRLWRVATRLVVLFIAAFIVLAILRGIGAAAEDILPLLVAALLVGAVTDGFHVVPRRRSK